MKIPVYLLIICFIALQSFSQGRGSNKYTVYFEYDSYSLTSGAKATLDSIYSKLQYSRYAAVTVEGYTDGRGSGAYNDTLALLRAKVVKDYLIEANPEQVIVPKIGFYNAAPDNASDNEKRKAVITLWLFCGYQPQNEELFYGPDGTIVSVKWYGYNKPEYTFVKINDIISTRRMIATGQYAVDSIGNIVRKGGTVDIEGFRSQNGHYAVKVPLYGRPDPT